jgi:hypothetical protein
MSGVRKQYEPISSAPEVKFRLIAVLAREIFVLSQRPVLNDCKQEAKGHTTFPDLLGTDQRKTGAGEVLLDKLTEVRSLVQLPYEKQATVGTDR